MPSDMALQTDKDEPSCFFHPQKPRQPAFAAELGCQAVPRTMTRSLLRVAVVCTGFYLAAGVVLAILAEHAQGVGWMSFDLRQWFLLCLSFFTLPITVLLWAGYAIIKRTHSKRPVAGLVALGIILPLLWAIIYYALLRSGL